MSTPEHKKPLASAIQGCRDALEFLGGQLDEADKRAATFADEVHGSIKGVHQGISEVQGELAAMREDSAHTLEMIREIRGLMRSAVSAASAIDPILKRLVAIEHKLGLDAKEGSNGNGAAA